MNIFLPGGCGYLGSQLTIHLLAAGHRVYIKDPGWFGCSMPDNEHVFRVEELPHNTDTVIYLAGLTNDTECAKNPALSVKANIEAFEELLLAYSGPLIFLSSVAAYGNSRRAFLEKQELRPTTPYGECKKACEAMLGNNHTILRPAGVFGYSARMRFDLTVNRMVRDAFFRGKIFVHGGEQYRPHVHIRDLIDAILFFVSTGKKGVYNVAYDNQTVMETAGRVQSVIPCEIVVEPRQDSRSYQVSNKKLERAGIICGRSVEAGARDMLARFKSGYWKDAYSDRSMNVPSL